MTGGIAPLDLIIARFPEHRDSLERLYIKGESFRSLCDDIRECLAALETWSRSTAEDAPAYRKESAALFDELEEELLEDVKNEGEFIDYRSQERDL
jgi:hypothetical protein